MSRNATKLLSALLCINLTACTSMRVVPDWQRSVAHNTANNPNRSGLNVGDELLVTAAHGRQVSMKLTAIESQMLVGRGTAKPDNVRLPFDQISQVERTEFDGLKTTGLVVLIVLIVNAGLAAALKNNVAFFPPPP